MKKNFYVSRNNIFVGQVISVPNCRVYKKIDDNERLVINNSKFCRNILFKLSTDLLGEDLLFDSPKYPILNISNDNICMNSHILIQNSYNLDMLLNYFNYKETLSYKDIKNLRRIFFNYTFLENNCDVFGMKEDKDNELGDNRIKILNNLCKNKLIKKMKDVIVGNLSNKIFIETGSYNELREYWYVLANGCNNSLFDIIYGDEKRIDTFKPVKEEKHIKKIGHKNGSFYV